MDFYSLTKYSCLCVVLALMGAEIASARPARPQRKDHQSPSTEDALESKVAELNLARSKILVLQDTTKEEYDRLVEDYGGEDEFRTEMSDLGDMGLPRSSRRRSEAIKGRKGSKLLRVLQSLLDDLEIYSSFGGILTEDGDSEEILPIYREVKSVVTSLKSVLGAEVEEDSPETDLSSSAEDLSAERFVYDLHLYNSMAKQNIEKVLEALGQETGKGERKQNKERKRGKNKKGRKNKKDRKDRGKSRKEKKNRDERRKKDRNLD